MKLLRDRDDVFIEDLETSEKISQRSRVGEQVMVEEDTHLQTHAIYSMGRRSGLAILNLRATVRMYWKGCIVHVASTVPPHASRCFSANFKEEGGMEG